MQKQKILDFKVIWISLNLPFIQAYNFGIWRIFYENKNCFNQNYITKYMIYGKLVSNSTIRFNS